MKESGFKITPGDHPIVPIMLGDAKVATLMAGHLLAEGIYVIDFSYPVVPQRKSPDSSPDIGRPHDRIIGSFPKACKSISSLIASF